MRTTLATSLFLLLAAALAATPLEEINELEPQRSSILGPLGDLSLSNEQALEQISERINKVLGVPADQKNFWSSLIAKEVKYDVQEVTKEAVSEQALQAAQKILDKAFDKIRKAKQGMTSQGEELLNESTQAAKAIYLDAVAEIGVSMKEIFAAKLRSDFAYALTHQEERVPLELDLSIDQQELHGKSHSKAEEEEPLRIYFDASVAEPINLALFDNLNAAMEEFDLDFGEEDGHDISTAFSNSLEPLSTLAAELAHILVFMVNGADVLRVEAKYMFNVIQHYSTFPQQVRLDRMTLVMKLLVLFTSSKINSPKYKALADKFKDEVEDFTQYIRAFVRAIVRGKAPKDENFAALGNAVIRELLIITKSQLGFQRAYKECKKLVGEPQEILQTHLEPFMKAYTQRHVDLVAPPAGLVANHRDYLRAAAIITALPFDAVNEKWFDSLLPTLDSLLAIDPNTLNVLGYATLQLHPAVVPVEANQVVFAETLFEAILTFLEANGPEVDPEHYNEAFDHFLDLYAKQSSDTNVRSNYFFMKILNIFMTPKTINYEVVFVKLAEDDKEEAKRIWAMNAEKAFEKLNLVAGHAYIGATSDNQGFEEGKHIGYLLTAKDLTASKFEHSHFHEFANTQPTTGRPLAQRVDVRLTVLGYDPTAYLNDRVHDSHSENKILVDSGLSRQESTKSVHVDIKEEEEINDHHEEVADSDFEKSELEVPPLVHQPSIIPNEQLEHLVQKQIQDTIVREEIEQQVTQILNEEPEEPQLEDGSQDHHAEETPQDLTGATIVEIAGELTPQEKKLLEQPNLEAILKELTEINDELGNVTNFAYVKLVPKKSDCYKTLFG